MYYLLIGYVQKWNSILEMGNKNLHVIIVVKFTSEELIGSYTEKKESNESSLTVMMLSVIKELLWINSPMGKIISNKFNKKLTIKWMQEQFTL